MKVYEEEISPAGKKRILLAVGIEEIKLLCGLVDKALLTFPIGESWKPDGARLRNMSRELSKLIKPTNQQEKR